MQIWKIDISYLAKLEIVRYFKSKRSNSDLYSCLSDKFIALTIVGVNIVRVKPLTLI